MTDYNNLLLFYSGKKHFQEVKDTFLADRGEELGFVSTYPGSCVVDLSSDIAESLLSQQFQILIVEDDFDSMKLIIDAALSAVKRSDKIGICPDHETLNYYMQKSIIGPKVMSLDLQLSKDEDPETSLNKTSQIYSEISQQKSWNDTVIIGISYHARDEIAQSLREQIYERGDSLYQKEVRHFPKVLPDIFIDALSKYKLRIRLSAEEDKTASYRQRPTLKDKNTHSRTIIGNSPEIIALIDAMDSVADSMVKVMLRGETGTGKELCARYIHEASPQAGGNFVPVNCAAHPDHLLERELFGHVGGVFANALKDGKGLIEEADGGTLFLDEIGDIPLLMQTKLLRLLQSGEYRRLGDPELKHFSGRVVSATNANLELLIEDGLFRDDLFFRLNGETIRIPPLRQRPTDIPVLINSFCQKFSCSLEFDEPTMSYLQSHDWPGNVRELESIIEFFAAWTKNKSAKIPLEKVRTKITQNTLSSHQTPSASEKNKPPNSDPYKNCTFLKTPRHHTAEAYLEKWEESLKEYLCHKPTARPTLKPIAAKMGCENQNISGRFSDYKKEIHQLGIEYPEKWPCLRKLTSWPGI